MALSVSFSVSQTLGLPQNINLVDTTTGSDVTAVARRLYFVNAQGQYLTEDYTVSDSEAYISWPLVDGNSVTLTSILSVDSALNITLKYVNVSGVMVAEDTSLEGFTMYNETFYYSLTQDQAQQNMPPPVIIQDSNYFMNKMILRVNIDSGNNAILYGDDIASAQDCYSMATYMVLKENDFF